MKYLLFLLVVIPTIRASGASCTTTTTSSKVQANVAAINTSAQQLLEKAINEDSDNKFIFALSAGASIQVGEVRPLVRALANCNDTSTEGGAIIDYMLVRLPSFNEQEKAIADNRFKVHPLQAATILSANGDSKLLDQMLRAMGKKFANCKLNVNRSSMTMVDLASRLVSPEALARLLAAGCSSDGQCYVRLFRSIPKVLCGLGNEYVEVLQLLHSNNIPVSAEQIVTSLGWSLEHHKLLTCEISSKIKRKKLQVPDLTQAIAFMLKHFTPDFTIKPVLNGKPVNLLDKAFASEDAVKQLFKNHLRQRYDGCFTCKKSCEQVEATGKRVHSLVCCGALFCNDCGLADKQLCPACNS